MANRDLTTFRSVLPSGEVESRSQIADAALAVTNTIVQRSQQAKINANMSQAQLDLNRLDNDFRTQNQKNPFDKVAAQEYKQQRQDIFDTMGEDVLPMYRSQWNQATQKLTSSSDLSNQSWAFKQAHVNTVRDVNSSIKNNLALAEQAGRSLALGTDTEVETALNYAPGRQQLEQYATQNLGAGDAEQLLNNYDNDYVKMVISGAAAENPVFALQLFDTSTVQDALKDDPKFGEFKKAVEARALNFTKVQSQQAKLNILRDETNMLSQSSITQPIPYAQLQAEFARQGTPPALQDVFLRANGYKTASGPEKLTGSEKQRLKVGIFDAIMKVTTSEEMNTEDVEALKQTIFDATDKGALTKKEQTTYLNDLLIPFADQRESELEGLQDNPWLALPEMLGGPADVGFGKIQQFYEENVAVPIVVQEDGLFGSSDVVLTPGSDEYEAEATDIEREVNTNRRLALYSAFTNKLMQEAATAGTTITGLTELEDTQRREIFKKAEDYAIKEFAGYVFPGLRDAEELPNVGVTGSGQRIPLHSNNTENVKVDFDVNDLVAEKTKDPATGKIYVDYKDADGVVRSTVELAPDGVTRVREWFFDTNGNTM